MKVTHHRHNNNANTIRFSYNEKALFSYETLVALVIDNVKYVDIEKYSRTTQKHITQFTDNLPTEYLTQKELQKKFLDYFANKLVEEFDEEFL